MVLGPTGRNFAAGMSGGIAYVFDPDRTFADRVNGELVELESLLAESDLWLVQGLIERHVQLTGAPSASEFSTTGRSWCPRSWW